MIHAKVDRPINAYGRQVFSHLDGTADVTSGTLQLDLLERILDVADAWHLNGSVPPLYLICLGDQMPEADGVLSQSLIATPEHTR